MKSIEKTLDETIKDAQDLINLSKERNLNNIQKIEARAIAASGEEKTRLEGLLQLHMNHKIELEGKDAIVEGTKRFNERTARLNK